MYRIRTYNPDDKDVVTEQLVYPHQRNPDAYTLSLLDDNVHAYVATDSGTPIGVMALDVRPAGTVHETCAVISSGFEQYVDVSAGKEVGFVKTAYTHPSRTGEGVGRALLSTLEAVAVLNDIPHLLAEAWVHGGDDSPDTLLEGAGFRPVELPDRIAMEDWVQDDKACVKCTGSCTCRAVLYEKPL